MPCSKPLLIHITLHVRWHKGASDIRIAVEHVDKANQTFKTFDVANKTGLRESLIYNALYMMGPSLVVQTALSDNKIVDLLDSSAARVLCYYCGSEETQEKCYPTLQCVVAAANTVLCISGFEKAIV